MRNSYLKAVAIIAAIAFSASGMAVAEPLQPGKPAGVHAAQMGNKEWLVFGGLTVLVAAIVIANTGAGEHHPVVVPPVTVVSP